MNPQLSINFAGARRRDAGHKDALAGFALSELRIAIINAARSNNDFTFTSDDVWRELSPLVRTQLLGRRNALGAVIRSAAVEHLIVATDRMRHSERPEGRKRKVTVWRLRTP